MRKIILFLVSLICVFPSLSLADEPKIYQFNINARSIGLGRSTVGLGTDYAASGNPAALGRETTLAFSVSQARLVYDRYGYQLMLVVPLTGALGIRFDQVITRNASYYRLLFNPDGTPVIDPVTNHQAQELNYDTQIDSLFGLAYGLLLFRGLSLGIEGQAIHLKVGESYAWGFDAAVGANLRLMEMLTTGVKFMDANSRWRAWHNPYWEERARPQLDIGISWDIEYLNLRLTTSVYQELEWYVLPRGKAGMEYAGFEPLVLRAGWDADHLNLGAGFTWQAIVVDYSVIIGGTPYDANRITLKIIF